ncbi:MAG: TraB/GumN family protein [Niameybacter sp.]|uniref:TraB/GumN family protein n=1 Tax=Niameybacter sp. TaxID=2033640 RepID=UPI002FC93723
MFKKVLSLGLIAVMMAGACQVFAQESVQPADWALSELNDAQAYGVAPNGFEKQLNEVLTIDQLNFIAEGLRKKCEEAGLVLEQASEIKRGTTREAVLDTYYEVLKGYQGRLDLKSDYLAYMRDNQIVKGYGQQELGLEQDCTLQEALVLATRVVENVYEQLGLGTEGFLWEVSDEDSTVYLLGTVHIGKSEVYPLSKGLNEVLENADKIALEVDFGNQEGLNYLAQKQMYTDGTTLEDHVDAETYRRTVEALEAFGIPEGQTKLFKPWAIANTLTVLTAQATENLEEVGAYQPIDAYVYMKGLFEEKDILEIEGYAFQADLFENIPIEYQLESLNAGLDMIETITTDKAEISDEKVAEEAALMNEMLQYLKTGDIEGFTAVYPKDESIESGDIMAQALFEGRDAHMSEKVVEYLQDENKATYVVVVGAGHMIGKGGIVSRLEKLGYTVNIVPR